MTIPTPCLPLQEEEGGLSVSVSVSVSVSMPGLGNLHRCPFLSLPPLA